MTEFMALPNEEKKLYFEKVGEIKGLPYYMVQKDFWVCWTLQRLFLLPDLKNHFTFKGGTSLSKIFGVIKRFSEDIDISIEKNVLGFTNERDPEQVQGQKKRNKLIEELSGHCKAYIKKTLLPKLEDDFGSDGKRL